jgi:hypothetical protein
MKIGNAMAMEANMGMSIADVMLVNASWRKSKATQTAKVHISMSRPKTQARLPDLDQDKIQRPSRCHAGGRFIWMLVGDAG